MLEQLYIRNIALIDELTIELGSGFNVLSGETGAGKSIIIDSLNLILGERADKSLVRSGQTKARVEGVFGIEGNTEVHEILEENGIECDDDTLIIVRELTNEGKSLCRINGSAVTLSLLKRAADKLADIHGQHEHQLLLDNENQLNFLDDFGGEAIKNQKENVCLAYTYLKSCSDKLNGDWGTEEERQRKAEMLRYQIDEIEKAQITPGQEEEMRARRELLANADKIRLTLEKTHEIIKGGVLDGIREASSELEKIADVDEKFSQLYDRIESAFYELEDISEEASSLSEQAEADPYELERIEDRLSQLKKLYRKYGSDEEAVMKYYCDACSELEKLENAQETIEELKKQREQFRREYDLQAEKLSELRHDTAIEFEDRLKKELEELGMKNAYLQVDFSENEHPSPQGKEGVEFLFSANAGEEPKPLAKIISGGEMSRFMLALKSIAASDSMLQTMVFDEIDTGISGQGALVVAQKIAKIAKEHQVIVITHLSQLASMADEHFLIKKVSDGIRTHTQVVKMDEQMRRREIARLAGGDETQLALERADEIILQARNFKKTI